MKVLLFTFIMVTVPAIQAQTILFEDDFNDGNADGWTELEPEGTYIVNDSLRYELSYPGTGNVDPVVVRGDSANYYMTTTDYSVLVEVIAHDPTDYSGVAVRVMGFFTGYVAWIRYEYDDICIFRHDAPESYVILAYSSCGPLEYGEAYWVRFECEGSVLRAKLWQGTVGDEPASWLLSAVDNTYLNNGCMAMISSHDNGGSCDSEFDNVVVTAVEPGALNQETWAAVKSTF